MDISVHLAAEDVKPVFARLLELNAHEFSAFDGRDVDEHGAFGYPYLDLYWTETEVRCAYLIRCESQVAGVALVRLGPLHSIAEFFILRKYRRRSGGAAAALQIFRSASGDWLVHQVPGNHAATEFWRAAIPYPFTEQVDKNGTTQRFTVDP